MKKFTKILCIVLAVFVSFMAVSMIAFSAGKKTINSGSRTPSTSAGNSGQSSFVPLTDDELFVYYANQLNDSNTSRVFVDWYARTSKTGKTKYQLLETFFSMLAYHNDTTHTVQFVSPSASNNSGETRGTPLDDLADKKAQSLYTDSGEVADSNSWLDLQGNERTDGEDWASENRLTWYVRANALSLENGEMNVIAIEGIDSSFDVTGENAPVYTFQLSPWFKETDDGIHLTKSWRANYAAGYAPFNDNIGLDGNARIMTWHASFGGGYTTYESKLTSGAYRDPATFTSATDGNTAAKKWNSYEGVGADANLKWALYEWQHRHFNLENSGIADGCVDYNYQVTVAVEETGVKRVLLSQEDASDFVVGSNVYVGDANQNRNTNQKSYVDNGDDGIKEDLKKDGTRAGAPDRSNAQSRNVSDGFAKILSKTTVNVGGTNYIALNLELSETINTTSTTWVSTAPWDTGSTESLRGHADGSPNNLTNGKNPLRVAGMEVLIGCYYVGLDVLYNTSSTSGGYNYTVYECKNSANYASSITANYVSTGITFSAMPSGWAEGNYIKSFVITDKPVIFPSEIGGSETTFMKSAFYGAISAGVRCPWRFGYLHHGAYAGLACGNGDNTPSNATWSGAVWLTGAEKIRGELAG